MIWFRPDALDCCEYHTPLGLSWMHILPTRATISADIVGNGLPAEKRREIICPAEQSNERYQGE